VAQLTITPWNRTARAQLAVHPAWKQSSYLIPQPCFQALPVHGNVELDGETVEIVGRFGEPAGTRTQDHLIKSLPVGAFFAAKSMMWVPNFRVAYMKKAAQKGGIW
jgi:hypothetical protein